MENVNYRLCKVRLKEKEQEFVVDKLSIMKWGEWYPAAHIEDPHTNEKIYLILCEHFYILCSSDGVEEKPDFILKSQQGDVKSIKIRIANIELFQWFSNIIEDLEFGQVVVNNDINIKNNMDNSEWREYFSAGQKYLYVRRRGTHDVAVQVRKGAIFYIGIEDLEKFNVLHLSHLAIMSDEDSYSIMKEIKYIISNLIK